MVQKINFENIRNSKVLLRCDFNEPIKNGELLSDKRILANVNTIQELTARNNTIILISHHSDKEQTLSLVYNYLKKIFPEIYYLNTTNQENITSYFLNNKNDLPKIILLENTRLFFLDENKEVAVENLDELNNENFAKFLSSFSDFFIYDAFSVGHRDHASTTGASKILPSCFGLTFKKEYFNLKKLLDEMPNTLIFMGGAKLSTKLPILEKFLANDSVVCLGGAMAHPILKMKGADIKKSFTEDGVVLSENIYNNKNLILPKDLIWNTDSERFTEKSNTNLEEKIVDDIFDVINLEEIIVERKIKNILWNGPVGMYEDGYVAGTDIIKNFLEKMHAQKMNTIVGGGDTLTYLEKYPDFRPSYTSLSGGAMLSFLAEGTLPVLKSIEI